jgi:nitrate reductase gamma subunit
MSSVIVYPVAYAGLLVCVGIVACKVRSYLQKPVHVRWELYPVAHEAKRASYGGSYLEDVDWWKNKQHPSFIAGMKGLLTELLFLHMTLETNTKLWCRTYPFHAGLYCLLGAFFFTVMAAIAQLSGTEPGLFLILIGKVVQVLTAIGFLGVIGGGIGLLHRRLTQEDLRRYSTPEHYFNLGAFILFGVLGLFCWIVTPSFFALSRDFTANMISFNFPPIESVSFVTFALVASILAAYVPATHMGHFFMKYFLYHDIRWGDQPTQDNPVTQKKIGVVLGYPVSWKAPHIAGDGIKSWAEVATTNPARPKE